MIGKFDGLNCFCKDMDGPLVWAREQLKKLQLVDNIKDVTIVHFAKSSLNITSNASFVLVSDMALNSKINCIANW